MSAEPGQFAALFDDPSIAKMYALTPKEFERFVAYVLRRAGYDVKEVGFHFLRGVDLEMRLPGKSRIVGGVECKRFASEKPVKAAVVKGVKGAAAVDKPGSKPFVITTSDFNIAAHQLADSGAKRAYLINGAQLLRYIAYIKGSRHDDESVLTTLSPEFFTGNGSRPRLVSDTKILTVANNKGGVGKTTTAYYLGAELARQGKRVLLIDLDGQANLTEWCVRGMAAEQSDENERTLNITQYFTGEAKLHELVTPAGMDRLSIIPSDPFLRLRELGGSGRPDIETQFVSDVEQLCTQHIASLDGTPQWIIIDTPPAMSVFTRAGLAAARYVIAPVRPRNASLKGTENMIKTFRTMNALTQNNARFLGMVITHWDGLALSRRFEEVSLPRALPGFGGQVFQTRIPMDNQLEVVQPGAKTGGAKAYTELAEEVIHDVN